MGECDKLTNTPISKIIKIKLIKVQKRVKILKSYNQINPNSDNPRQRPIHT